MATVNHVTWFSGVGDPKNRCWILGILTTPQTQHSDNCNKIARWACIFGAIVIKFYHPKWKLLDIQRSSIGSPEKSHQWSLTVFFQLAWFPLCSICSLNSNFLLWLFSSAAVIGVALRRHEFFFFQFLLFVLGTFTISMLGLLFVLLLRITKVVLAPVVVRCI